MRQVEPLQAHEMQALEFLAKAGHDCVGLIDTEEKLAAALVYHDLKQRGYILSTMSDDGPVYWLSNAGKLEAVKHSGVMQ